MRKGVLYMAGGSVTRKDAAAKRATPDEPAPRSFNYRPDEAMNVRVREYLLAHGITFNDLCEEAIRDFLDRHPRWNSKKKTLRLPPGRRPRLL